MNEEQQIPKEVKEKFKQIKNKLEKFKDQALKQHKKEIIGISLLPPKEDQKDKINVLVVLNDTNSEDVPDYKLKDSVAGSLIKIANSIDKKLYLEILLVSELREMCFDGKYEILQLIAIGAHVYDPTDLLAALKISEVHKTMTIKKFEKYIVSYVAAGSLFRGEKANDIDVYIIVDDTDVKRMSRVELRDRLRRMAMAMADEAAMITQVKKEFHIQVYILTDFWESLKEANPVIFTLLRDGVPLFDRGTFTPWRLLLKMGRIRPSPEAIDMHMDIGEGLVKRAKAKLLSIVAEDLYYAALNPSQAALMLYGISPPTPKETVKLLKEIFVKKEKLLEKKYVDLLEEIRVTFKKVEHRKMKEIKGAEVDILLDKVDDYLKRIKRLFDQINKKKEKEFVFGIYDESIKVVEDVLKGAKYKKIETAFEKFCEQNKMVGLPEIFGSIIKAKKDYKEKKLVKAELDKVKRQSARLVRVLVNYMQRLKAKELEKCTIRFKYGEETGELIILGKDAFITTKGEIKKAGLKEGVLVDVKDSSVEELEKSLVNLKPPGALVLKEKTFKSLKELFGKNLEIVMGY